MAPEDSPSALTAIPEFIGVACRFASPSLNAAFSAFRRDAALALRLHQLAWLTALALLWELSVRSIAVSGDDATVRSALVALAVHAYAGPRLQCGRLGAAALAACGTIACSAVVASGGGGGALGFAASLIATLTVLHYAASPLDFRVACALAAVPPLVHPTAPFLDAPLRPHSWLLWCGSVIVLLAWSVVHAVLAWTVRVNAAHESLLAHFAPELHAAVLAAARAAEVFPHAASGARDPREDEDTEATRLWPSRRVRSARSTAASWPKRRRTGKAARGWGATVAAATLLLGRRRVARKWTLTSARWGRRRDSSIASLRQARLRRSESRR